MNRIMFLALAILFATNTAYGQSTEKKEAEKQLITIYYDLATTWPMKFKDSPLEQLAGTELTFDYENFSSYHSTNGSIQISGVSFQRKHRGVGFMIYPLGLGNNTTLTLKGGHESLPNIRFKINSPNGVYNYTLTDGDAYDLGIGAISDSGSSGWLGFGANAYIIVGTGWLDSSLGPGHRYFAEFGGGLGTNLLKIGFFAKLNRNQLNSPVPHHFYTIPIGVRTMISF
ncbi:MAG: hypothetical protein Q7S43_02135 [bacterium]|nr:hypothetical protein [bacterium]